MKILKKASLIIIGTLLSLIFLEIGLQTISLTITAIKNYKTNKLLKNKNTLTILCLGESTTDNTWPPILQKILDKRAKNKKFNVIDVGKAGCNTNDILPIVSEILLEENKIDIIISMMGINDIDNNIISIKRTRFKTIKLFYLIKTHLISNLFANNNIEHDNSLVKKQLEKAQLLLSLKQFAESNKILKSIDDVSIGDIEKKKKYELLIRNSLSLNDNKINTNNYLEIKQYLNTVNKIEPIFDLSLRIMIYEKNIEKLRSLLSDKTIINLYFDSIMCSLNDLSKIGANDVVEQINNTIYDSINDDSKMYAKIRELGYVALNYFVEKDYIKANNFFNLQTNLLLKNIPEQTSMNYLKLYDICKNNNIKLIAMQYPIRSIKPLKEILKECEGITFISNEENFKLVLKAHKLDEIFTDRFAGDFGHCTDFGNTLIAENVAEIILKLYI